MFMKPVSAKISKPLVAGSYLDCVDNTGAKKVQLISVVGYKGRRRKLPSAGVGNIIICSVKKGTQKWRKQKVRAVIVRQKKEYRRANGMRVAFEDNAVVIVNEKGEPQGSSIRGPVAREVVERFLSIGKIASSVV